MPTTYSATSSLLNVDTYSLSNQVDGDYYGFAESGMILKGETSGAQAVISNTRLVSDIAANVQEVSSFQMEMLSDSLVLKLVRRLLNSVVTMLITEIWQLLMQSKHSNLLEP